MSLLPENTKDIGDVAKLPYYFLQLAVARLTNPPAFRGVVARIRNLQKQLGRPAAPHEMAEVLKNWLEAP